MFGQSLLSGAFGTALVPDENFNTLLYTGDGTSSRSITGVGFAPDFVWTKKRGTSTGNNILENAVVGPGTGQALYSNSSQAAGYNDQYGYISSFDTDGVTYQEGSSGSYPNDNANESGSTYVQWNWKSGADTHAGKFNGSSSKIDLPSILPANSTASSTATCWFNTSYSGANMGTIFSAWNGGTSDPGWGLWTEGNQNFLRMADYYLFGSVVGTDGTTNVSDGKWHFVAVVFDYSAGTLNCYLDGNSTPEISITGTSAASVDIWTTNSSIGVQNPGGPIRYFDGQIDQVRIFNTALTQSQITYLYGETSGNNNTLNFPAGAGCVAAYTLNETANDLSGNYNGTPSNITYVKPGYTGKNNDGTIESQVSANQDAGFSVVKFGSSSSASTTVGHGLGAIPQLVIAKRLDSTGNWAVQAPVLGNGYVLLNTSGLYQGADASIWNNTAPTSSVFTTAGGSGTFFNAGDFIAYVFTSITGFSKIGTYTWSGGYVAGTMVTGLGFKPAKVIIKGIDGSASDWQLYDNKRGATTSASKWQAYALYANEAIAESTSGYQGILFDDDGFSAGVGDDGNTTASGSLNKNGTTYLYIAIAE